MRARPAAAKGAIWTTEAKPVTSRPPMSHRIMRKVWVKSEMYWVNRLRLEKKKFTATPARSRVAVVRGALILDIP